MKLTVAVKLQPTSQQSSCLRDTLQRANAAANAISAMAWESETWRQYDLHKLVYHRVRASSGLAAQIVVRMVAKVADAYKVDRKRQRLFRPLGSIAYDDRLLRWYADAVSIWTTDGRQRIPFACDKRAAALLSSRRGESDLVLREGKWYLIATVDVVEPLSVEPTDWLGVDVGIVNLATDSDGNTYSGATLERNRRRHLHRRRNLQRKGTKSAKQKLKTLKGKQARFQRHTNHALSKRIVAMAKGTGRGIALEDLTGIRERVTASRKQRARLANWGFAQLHSFVCYKAKLAGVPVVFVDPRYTSRTCPCCACVDKRNRPRPSAFQCIRCGFVAPADAVAARNIRVRAAVNQPNVGFAPDSDKVGVVGSHEQATLTSRPL